MGVTQGDTRIKSEFRKKQLVFAGYSCVIWTKFHKVGQLSALDSSEFRKSGLFSQIILVQLTFQMIEKGKLMARLMKSSMFMFLLAVVCAVLGPQTLLAGTGSCSVGIFHPTGSVPAGPVYIEAELGGPIIAIVTGTLTLDGTPLFVWSSAPSTSSTTVSGLSAGTHTLAWVCSVNDLGNFDGTNSGKQTFTVQ